MCCSEWGTSGCCEWSNPPRHSPDLVACLSAALLTLILSISLPHRSLDKTCPSAGSGFGVFASIRAIKVLSRLSLSRESYLRNGWRSGFIMTV
ncbi:hypothetical protein BO79DRAFT_64378 [Aspergillus costaricaensis CBS 115574]|uniref:Uncharacterized protein n=1 Tax=Aspergillus costaricaensis CBS 115574 TaxID=1448317 RepID=A0ACD1IPR5_9EURO|nr:hypothetical protein BO79DRAFT_64378 [Aspergillus costaricaensis CBS 115574]RAK92370.1 hypothetical protein BO79DRAFT_64378 [Aspergillus costaricaensis CBS 115574]